MAGQAKRYRQALKSYKPLGQYTIEEAAKILSTFPKAKFDESVDVAIRLGVDPKKPEENIRGVVELPHGTGKTVRVLAFCKGDKVKEAEAAGADYVGTDEYVTKIQGGWMDFDAVVATPDVMVTISKVAKILGPRGLMPNPKVGTVTPDVAKAITAIKAGRVEFRVEKAGIVQAPAGKVSFGAEKIKENVSAFIQAIMKVKPNSLKGNYIESIYLSTTMGPSVCLDLQPYRAE